MIAATAMANELPLYACNPDDFDLLDGLTVVPVPIPEELQEPRGACAVTVRIREARLTTTWRPADS